MFQKAADDIANVGEPFSNVVVGDLLKEDRVFIQGGPQCRGRIEVVVEDSLCHFAN